MQRFLCRSPSAPLVVGEHSLRAGNGQAASGLRPKRNEDGLYSAAKRRCTCTASQYSLQEAPAVAATSGFLPHQVEVLQCRARRSSENASAARAAKFEPLREKAILPRAPDPGNPDPADGRLVGAGARS